MEAALQKSPHTALPVLPSRTLTPVERVDIYNKMYFHRILEAMQGDFSAVRHVVGDEIFSELVAAYLASTPPTHFSIRYAGKFFAESFAHHALTSAWPWLADLARLQWTLLAAYDALDAPALRAEDLSALPADAWPTRVLHTTPATQRLDLTWPAQKILEAVTEEQSLPDIARKATSLLIWRRTLDVEYRVLTPLEAELIDAVQKKITFSDLCELALAHVAEEQVIACVGNFLQQWVSEGILA